MQFHSPLPCGSTLGTTGTMLSQPSPKLLLRRGSPHRQLCPVAVRRGSPRFWAQRQLQHIPSWTHSAQRASAASGKSLAATSCSLPITSKQLLLPQPHPPAGHLTSVQHPSHPLSLFAASGFPTGTTEVRTAEPQQPGSGSLKPKLVRAEKRRQLLHSSASPGWAP